MKNKIFSLVVLVMGFLALAQTNSSASCTAKPTWKISGDTIWFTADASNGAGTKFSYNFGDGTNSHDRSPKHVYAKDGVYRFCVEVNDSPCADHFCETITIGHPKYCITGNVFAGSHNAYPGYVLLYKYNYADSTWHAVDTAKLTSTNNGRYEFGHVEQGRYMVKAVLDSTSAYYKKFLPGYYSHATRWGKGNVIEIYNGCAEHKDIHLHENGNHKGKGKAKGHVKNKHKKMADEDLEVLLLDDKDSIVEWTTTDVDGNFTFTDIANGNYKIYTEFTGLVTMPAAISISDANYDISNIEIVVTQTSVVTSVADANTKLVNGLVVYPNPATSVINANINSTINADVMVNVTDITGKTIISNKQHITLGANQFSVDVSSFAKGVYILNINNNKGVLQHSRFEVK